MKEDKLKEAANTHVNKVAIETGPYTPFDWDDVEGAFIAGASHERAELLPVIKDLVKFARLCEATGLLEKHADLIKELTEGK